MKSTTIAAGIMLLGPLLLAGCATPPVETATLQPSCSWLRAEQGGKPVPPVAGIVTVARAPFTLTYVGPGREPSIHASTNGGLGAWLMKQARPEVWVPFGQGLAASPGMIYTDDKPQAALDNEKRRAVTTIVSPKYWPLVREQVEARKIDAVVRAGVNVWWEPGAPTAPRVYRVANVDDQPIEKSTFKALHFLAFGEMERVAGAGIPMLARTRWNACTVRFSS